MEKMVTDPEIKKVVLICDEKYAAKADGRMGGVGTETQIISREVYENQAQEKFVAVVREKDESGKAYLPTYYKSRIYIDLSEEDRYIVHELFLYAVAILLKHDRIEQANYLLQQQYYLPINSEYGRDVMVSLVVFWNNMRSLEHRNERLGLRRLSLRAELLKERCTGIGIEFRHLQQADFVAFMRAEFETRNNYFNWWPETLVYLGPFNDPFELFARSISKSYFNKSKVLLSIDTPNDLEPLLKSYQDGSRRLPSWGPPGIDPALLLGFKHLATRP